jgi:O-methyltransferase involved in polyketide biosynthesis
MDGKNIFPLKDTQETLLLPLWARAIETKKHKPVFFDEKAVEIASNISYDLSRFSKEYNRTAHFGFIARSMYYDKKIKEFIKMHPEATIVNIGCGLDTTFERIDNGKIQWIDLDFPEVIDFRRKYISDSDRRIFISNSVFDTSWYNIIKNKKETMFMIAGVLEYFTDQEIIQIFNDFVEYCPGVEIVFDYCSKIGLKAMNKSLEKTTDIIKSARLIWSISDVSDIVKVNNHISIIHNMTIYREFKKNCPFYIRLLLSYFDFWKISSLAHIKINK